MCGIFTCIYKSSKNNGTIKLNLISDNILRRGPDCYSTHQETCNDTWTAEFAASVLWMQGSKPVTQPCIDDQGNILLWNGDIFSGPLASNSDCDTLILLNKLKSSDNIPKTLSLIEGPYSFIYYQKSTKLLFFGRDPIGRHSLLIKIKPPNNRSDQNNEAVIPTLLLCSVATKMLKNIHELPALGVYTVNLNDPALDLSCYPWNQPDDDFITQINNLQHNLNFSEIKTQNSVFNTQIELLPDTISSTIDYIAAVKNCTSLKSTADYRNVLKYCLENSAINQRVTKLLQLLRISVENRVKKAPRLCKACAKLHIDSSEPKNVQNSQTSADFNCKHAKIGILFSGGLDSTILAAVAAEFIPENEPIDLLNVAFEKKSAKTQKNGHLNESGNFDVPDRQTGRLALQELELMFPKHHWKIVEINIKRSELVKYAKDQICHVIYPLNSILDESLGCAVWFGSRGSGNLNTGEVYVSPCRVLLLGMGADELFGGYTRHRTTLKREGWSGLNAELSRELARISVRNLGRDDRVVADHGRQSRLPYLDENVVKYVQSLPAWERCCPVAEMPAGLGDKLLLRLVASAIGLKEVANFPKRAFQFGSRIADSKANATDVSSLLS